MGIIWGALIVLAVCLWFVTVFDLFKRHLGAGATAAWGIIILVIPYAGPLAYWILRKPPADEVQRSVDMQSEIRRGARPPRVGP
jgi:hypothetical protein